MRGRRGGGIVLVGRLYSRYALIPALRSLGVARGFARTQLVEGLLDGGENGELPLGVVRFELGEPGFELFHDLGVGFRSAKLAHEEIPKGDQKPTSRHRAKYGT